MKSDLQAKSIKVDALWFNGFCWIARGLGLVNGFGILCYWWGDWICYIDYGEGVWLGVAVVSITDGRSLMCWRCKSMFCSSVFTGKHSSELSKIGSDILGMVHVQRVDGKDLEWSVVQGFAELDGCCLCCSSEISEVRGRATECEGLSGEGGGGPEAERIGKQKEKRNKGKGGCEQGGADMRSVR